MTIGDSVSAHSSVLNNAYLTIQPGAGAEWMIQNLYFGGSWNLFRTDGSNTILITTGTGAGSLQNRDMICTNGIYYTIQNVSGGTVYMGYDGFVIK